MLETILERYPSGQRGRAVNALALPSKVQILPVPPKSIKTEGREMNFNDFMNLTMSDLKKRIEKCKIYELSPYVNSNKLFMSDVCPLVINGTPYCFRIDSFLQELYEELLDAYSASRKKRYFKIGFLRINIQKMIEEIDKVKEWQKTTASQLSDFNCKIGRAIQEIAEEERKK